MPPDALSCLFQSGTLRSPQIIKTVRKWKFYCEQSHRTETFHFKKYLFQNCCCCYRYLLVITQSFSLPNQSILKDGLRLTRDKRAGLLSISLATSKTPSLAPSASRRQEEIAQHVRQAEVFYVIYIFLIGILQRKGEEKDQGEKPRPQVNKELKQEKNQVLHPHSSKTYHLAILSMGDKTQVSPLQQRPKRGLAR